MLTKGTLNRQNRQQGQICDAGSVAMGWNGLNRYRILRTNDDGQLLVINNAPASYRRRVLLETNETFPVGLKLQDTLLARLYFNLNVTQSQIIDFVPNFYIQSATQPNVSLFIVERNGSLGGYIDALPIGNVYAPDINLLVNNRTNYFKHNVPMQRISETLNNWALPLTNINDRFGLESREYIFFITLHNTANIINPQTAIQFAT
jgi:hypothetical protein